MNLGLVDLEELKTKKSNLVGKTAYCFIKGDKVIKIYAHDYDKNLFEPLDIAKLCDFSKCSSDTIVFPIEYIYQDNKIIGEVLPYIKSDILSVAFNDRAIIKKIIASYEIVLGDLELYHNINMKDLCSVNILYSNKLGFHIIDTTEWEYTDDAFKLNLKRFNSSLVTVITENLDIPVIYGKHFNQIDETFYNNMAKYGYSGKNLQKNMVLLMSDTYRFLDMIYAFMDVYRVHYSSEMKNLKDMKEITKVLKKG